MGLFQSKPVKPKMYVLVATRGPFANSEYGPYAEEELQEMSEVFAERYGVPYTIQPYVARKPQKINDKTVY